ncbi:glycosyltransferase [Lachnospiraceae bacterium DSM 108991]|uniref:Glycosyltransferase n=1 Tax=Claveliimonas monacensis TaxID=2779351 RepID=A0ABR9RKH2_9FIRM|nr:glycosyltransferase [Claveliimonas monacensis]MBE5063457.1 glycosyltransferase [Claveliimonas monacensis]
MIKILQVVGKMHRAGMETLIMNIYRNIDRNKIQFDFCVHSNEPGAYDDEIGKLGGKIYHLPSARVSNLFKLQKATDTFFSKHNNYRAVHVHYSCVGYYYFKSAKKVGINNLIYHAHNSARESGARAKLRYLMEQQSAKKANIRFACSDLAAKYNFGNKDYIMLNNGINTRKYRFSNEVRLEVRKKLGIVNRKVCIHIGRFDIQKNHAFLIEAFDKAFQKNNQLELLLLGNGVLKEHIQKRVSLLSSAEHIHFLGNLDNVADMLSAADLFLLPSLYEGLPLTLVEAQTSGIKCLVSDVITKEAIVVPELVIQYSLISSDTWAEKILELMDYERQDTSDIVKQAGFDSNEIAKYMECFYQELR